MLINPDNLPARRITKVERKKTPSVPPVKKIEKISKPQPIDKHDVRNPHQETPTLPSTQPESETIDFTEDQSPETNIIDRKY